MKKCVLLAQSRNKAELLCRKAKDLGDVGSDGKSVILSDVEKDGDGELCDEGVVQTKETPKKRQRKAKVENGTVQEEDLNEEKPIPAKKRTSKKKSEADAEEGEKKITNQENPKAKRGRTTKRVGLQQDGLEGEPPKVTSTVLGEKSRPSASGEKPRPARKRTTKNAPESEKLEAGTRGSPEVKRKRTTKRIAEEVAAEIEAKMEEEAEEAVENFETPAAKATRRRGRPSMAKLLT